MTKGRVVTFIRGRQIGWTEKKQQVPPLRYPGFPVELGGVGELHAAFLTESRTRAHGWGRAVENLEFFAWFAKGGIHGSRLLQPF